AVTGVISQVSDAFINVFSEETGTNIEEVLCTVEKTKQAFLQLIKALKNQDISLIIVIDELERCKPEHALRFLECLKHVMCLGEIRYIISVDIDYLKNAVSHFYGNKIDPVDYLRKFFIVGYKLTRIKQDNFLTFINEFGQNTELNKIIAFVASETNSDLRTIERFLYILEASCKEREPEIFDIDSWESGSSIDGHVRRLSAYFYIWLFFMSYKDKEFINLVKLAGQKKLSELSENQQKLLSGKIVNFLNHIDTSSFSFKNFLRKTKSFFAQPDLNAVPPDRQADLEAINYNFARLVRGSRVINIQSTEYFNNNHFPYIHALIDSLEACNFLI
ncbi:MAG: KAP family NTPase, partial [Gammaproteobacteria bacterium]|nr:KAP family NTPase [Gammaproteobacteria bacterium]